MNILISFNLYRLPLVIFSITCTCIDNLDDFVLRFLDYFSDFRHAFVTFFSDFHNDFFSDLI